MKPRPIANPLPGEHLAAVFPRTEEEMSGVWHRRLRHFTGRSLGATALSSEQDGRAGRLALRGQMVSPGIVSGLEVALEPLAGPPPRRHFVALSAGLGVAASGEDVAVARPRRIALGDVEVVAPAALGFAPAPPAPTDGPGSPAPLPAEAPAPPGARRVWGPLADLLRRGAQLPPVGVLVLQPVVTESIARPATEDECGSGSTDPCEEDAASYAYEDWQLVDGARLLLYAWPADWIALPPQDARWRNRLAWAVFEAERGRAPDETMPWEDWGVPLALVGFDRPAGVPPADADLSGWTPRFADRNAVARLGGRPKRRSVHPAAAANSFLWQARVQQLSEELAGPELSALPATQLASRLRFLPPVGVLPKTAIDARAGRDDFFPGPYEVDAAPVPLEQLELVLRESAGLAPFDLDVADEVRVYVPVPQLWYEPGLLRVEAVDPEFQQTIDRFTLRRARWLARRADIRARASALLRAIAGRPAEYPDPDPEALEAQETVAGADDVTDADDPALASPEEAYGTTRAAAADGGAPPIAADALVRLKDELRARTPLRWRTRVALASLPANIAFPPALAPRLSYDANSHELQVVGRLTDAERDELLGLELMRGDTAYAAAVRQLHADSQADDLAPLDEQGVQGFIDTMERKAASADDTVDFGFTRVRTDIYRVRQFMLGTQAATRLATSPALAEIAQVESAAATQDALKSFTERVKLTEDPVRSNTLRGGTAGGGGVMRAGLTGGAALALSKTSGGSAGVTGGDRIVAGGGALGLSSGALAGAGELLLQTPAAGITATSVRTDLTTFTPTIGAGGTMAGRAGAAEAFEAAEVSRTVSAASVSSAFNVPAAPSAKSVTEQTPIVGKALDFRNVSVAERLKQPSAPEAKSFSVAGKYTVLTDLQATGLNLDDLQVPGFLDNNQHEVKRSFADIRRLGLAEEILQDKHDPDRADSDEADFFAGSVRALEHTIAALRVVEGRIQAYRSAIDLARRTLAELQGRLGAADGRLRVIGEELAEARHDVAVAKALLADEQARVNGINERRTMIVNEHVDFLVYQRPRRSDLVRDLPSRALDAGLAEAPAPACLRDTEHVALPPELGAMVELLRDAPPRWFTHVHPLLDRLDRVDALHRTLDAARRRALTDGGVRALALAPAADGSALGSAVSALYAAQQQVTSAYRARTAQLDLSALAGLSWARVRDQAADIVSVGDLMDAAHGRGDVARQVAREMDDIARVAGCLYARLGAVLPAIRLVWAERLSQYDAPANLRNLASLPRWGDIDRLERRAMQGLADWLFGRVDARQSDAVAMVNDLVRLCILLASHAPVDRIIAGHVHRDTPVVKGGRVELKVDLTRVRVGMAVHLFGDAGAVVARAVVEDLSAGIAAARVLDAPATTLRLAAGTRAQFIEPERAPIVQPSSVGMSAGLSPFGAMARALR